jgi:hypothetical protein
MRLGKFSLIKTVIIDYTEGRHRGGSQAGRARSSCHEPREEAVVNSTEDQEARDIVADLKAEIRRH